MRRKYKVFDTCNAYMGAFDTYQQALTYCISRGRTDWRIKQ